MQNLAFLVPVAAITVGPVVWAFNNWVRARHGYPLEESFGRHRSRRRENELGDSRKIALLTQENERLNGQVGRLEERLRVLERIATDPAVRTAREIDALRD
jgi:hypothetical protein